MRRFFLLPLLTVLACSTGSDDPTETDDTTETDTNEVETDTEDDTETEVETETEDDTEPDGPPNVEEIVGTWTVDSHTEDCGFGFNGTLTAEAEEADPGGFYLRVRDPGGMEGVLACMLSDVGTYTCSTAPFQMGAMETCMYQTVLNNIGGSITGQDATISATVSQNVVGPSCPPVPPCSGSASAELTIGD